MQVALRERAIADVEEAIDFYLAEASEEVALAFIGSLEQAYGHLAEHPGAGSPRYAHELDLPGLRSWSLKGYPYLVFYLERLDHIDVWRVLHGRRDLPSWLVDEA